MAKPKSRNALPSRPRRPCTPSSSVPQPVVVAAPHSTGSTPISSAHLSTYPTEYEEGTRGKVNPFHFLELPSELRDKVYGYVFKSAPNVIDLDPDNFRKIHRSLAIFCVSKQIHDEATHHFFSTHTVRLFPTYPGRFFKSKRPLLARLQPRYRASITSFELRLGPGFTNPPRGWTVNDALGLQDATNARLLKVMVEVDTSDPIFKGFRKDDDGFYEIFSKSLLSQVLVSTPSIIEIQFDAYPSVRKEGIMMKTLLTVAREHKKLISWGPERGWKDGRSVDWLEPIIASPAMDTRNTLNALSAALSVVATVA